MHTLWWSKRTETCSLHIKIWINSCVWWGLTVLLVIKKPKMTSISLLLQTFLSLILHTDEVCLFQMATKTCWSCDGPNRQLHVGRYAEQRRWHRTLDSGRMDPAHSDVRDSYSCCDIRLSYHPVNHTHRDKSWNDATYLVSFRLECITVLWTG